MWKKDVRTPRIHVTNVNTSAGNGRNSAIVTDFTKISIFTDRTRQMIHIIKDI